MYFRVFATLMALASLAGCDSRSTSQDAILTGPVGAATEHGGYDVVSKRSVDLLNTAAFSSDPGLNDVEYDPETGELVLHNLPADGQGNSYSVSQQYASPRFQ